MKDYEVTLYYTGSRTLFISAPDEEEAESIAYDELANLAGDLEYEVTDTELCEVDGGYDG